MATVGRAGRDSARVMAPVLALGALLVLLPAADAASVHPTVRKDETFLTAETGGVLAIEGGECFTDPGYVSVAGEVMVRYVPCDAGPAANQVYGFVAVPEGDGGYEPERVVAFGWETCERGFRVHWPGEDAAAGIDFYPVLPTAATWEAGDRDVMCVAYRPAGPLTGSLLPAL
ncbi:hypothetical protein N0X72_06860 [Streptomyces carpaticus]|uniref:hypothetical protein n=1 Tax=Streptomyces carpaticus TaxID=285558 RepID=UPI0021FC4E68|nr:hypothetical protein N0X72_06860 [Streptomyces carpaticus]